MVRHSLFLFTLFVFSPCAIAQLDFRPLVNKPTFIDGYLKGEREAVELERMRLETERLRIENENRQRQIEEARNKAAQQARRDADKKSSDDDVIKKWLAAAQPRIHLFNDFSSIVFSPDLRLTIPMIQVMSESRYAADIAYFLGGDKKVALQISLLDSLGVRAEISKIENLIRDKELFEAQEEIKKLRATIAQMEVKNKDANALADNQKKR